MAMEAKIETVMSDQVYAIGASGVGPAHTPRKYSDDVGNNNGGSRNHIGKGSKTNNSVVDVLDLAVPQSKVRPIDRLLDRYDWSSASMTPLLKDSDRPPRMQYGQLSHPGRSASSKPRRPPAPPPPPTRPPPPPPPPTRPPVRKEFSASKRPVRKSLWKRARELVRSFFVCAAASGPKVDCFWSH